MLARRLRSKFPALVSPSFNLQVTVSLTRNKSRRWQTTASTTAIEPPPAGGHSSSVASSQLFRITRESALRTPGISWQDEESDRNIIGGRETRKMNLYQAVRDALR